MFSEEWRSVRRLRKISNMFKKNRIIMLCRNIKRVGLLAMVHMEKSIRHLIYKQVSLFHQETKWLLKLSNLMHKISKMPLNKSIISKHKFLYLKDYVIQTLSDINNFKYRKIKNQSVSSCSLLLLVQLTTKLKNMEDYHKKLHPYYCDKFYKHFIICIPKI